MSTTITIKGVKEGIEMTLTFTTTKGMILDMVENHTESLDIKVKRKVIPISKVQTGITNMNMMGEREKIILRKISIIETLETHETHEGMKINIVNSRSPLNCPK